MILYLQDIGFALLRPPTFLSSTNVQTAWPTGHTFLLRLHPGVSMEGPENQEIPRSESFWTAFRPVPVDILNGCVANWTRNKWTAISPYLLKFLLAVLSPYRCRSPWSALVQLPICWSHSGHLDGRLVEPTRGQCARKIQMLLRRNIRIQALKFYLEGYCYHHVSLGLHGDVNVSDVLGVAPCSTVAVWHCFGGRYCLYHQG
jgi:hypothetical protein